MHALIIREPWIGRILDGSKTWEMRSTPTHKRGRIALIRQGTGLVIGTAEIADSLPPLDAAGLAATRDRHAIPAALDAEVLARGWRHPWVLRDVRRLPRPVPAGQKSGAVTWVLLAPPVAAAIDAQPDGSTAPPAASSAAAHASLPPPAGKPAAAPPAPRPVTSSTEALVQLTAGAIKNGYLKLGDLLPWLPHDVIGGPNKDHPAPRQLTAVFNPGQTIETDVDGEKKFLRDRTATRDFYARIGAKERDHVRLRLEGRVLHVAAAP